MRFLPYSPDQAYLLPPSVRDVVGEEHLCFFLHGVVERLDLSGFEQDYVEEGPPAYAPALMVKVWLYAYALGVTSSRRLEQRVREDLAFRYLAGGASPDHWTLNEFRRHHRRAINDLFTQVLELAREAGLGRLGHVAVDSTRVAANASRNRVESADARARIRNREIGFVFQSFNLIGDLTVFDNVELPLTYRGMSKAERKRRVQEALEKVAMAHRMRHYPAQLSGGEQQRVAVARALGGRPAMLLADEPTGNLDSKNAEAVMELLRQLHREGATIVMVTHDQRFAQYAERTVHLLDGRIVDGSAKSPAAASHLTTQSLNR